MLPQLCHLDARCLREPRRPLGGQPRPKYANCMRDPLFTLVLAAIAAGCGPSDKGAPQAPPPTAAAPATATPSGAAGILHIASTGIGRSVNPDHTMRDATVLFIPTDDVWASVIVEGNAPRGTLQARWLTDSGDVVEESSQAITPTGRTVVAFHAAARPGGWPLGRYKLELLLDGVVGGTQPFEIRQPPL